MRFMSTLMEPPGHEDSPAGSNTANRCPAGAHLPRRDARWTRPWVPRALTAPLPTV